MDFASLFSRHRSVPPEEVVRGAAIVLALRWLDHFEGEREAEAAFHGQGYERSFPPHLRWDALVRSTGAAALADASGRLFSTLLRHGLLSPKRGVALELLSLPEEGLTRDALRAVADLPFETVSDRRDAGEFLRRILQRALKVQKYAGEFYTPENVAAVMVDLARPQPGERIYDPCFGTGGLLVTAVSNLWQRCRKAPPSDWAKVEDRSIFGVEVKFLPYLVGLVRLLLAGVRPGLELGDALERPSVAGEPRQAFDLVLANPPWGSLANDRPLDLPVEAHSYEAAFLLHILESLRPGGRAVLAVPASFLSRGGGDREVRRYLLEKHRLEAVYTLPRDAFRPFTSIPVRLLRLSRQLPAESVRVVDLAPRFTGQKWLHFGRPGSGEISAEEAAATVQEVPVSAIARADWRFDEDRSVEDPVDLAMEALLLAGSDAVRRLRLDEVAKITLGFKYRSEQVDGSRVDEYHARPLVRVGDIKAALTIREPDLHLNAETARRVREDQFLRRNDVVVTMSGTVGRVAIVDEHSEGNVAGGGLALLRVLPHAAVSAAYLALILADPAYATRLRAMGRGSTIPHLSLEDLGSVPIPVPPPALQQIVEHEVRERGATALGVLLEQLNDHSRDPVYSFLQRSPVIASYLLPGDGDPALSARLEEVARELEGGRELLSQAVKESSPDVAMFSSLAAAVRPLIGSGRFEQPLAALVALGAARSNLRDVLPVLRQAQSGARLTLGRVAERLRTALEQHWEERINRCTFRLLEPTVFSVNAQGRRETAVILNCEGEAPIIDFRLYSEPPGLQAHIEYLYGTATFLPLVLPEEPHARQGSADLFRYNVHWDGRLLDGSDVSGTIELEFVAPDAGQPGSAEPSLPFGSSPYITGNPVDRDAMFYGRRKVLEDIQRLLNRSGEGNVLLLEGPRRAGKSSILKQLLLPHRLEGWLPVYCSFQRAKGDAKKTGVPTEEVFRLIGQCVGEACLKAGVWIPLPGVTLDTTDPHSVVSFVPAFNRFFREDPSFARLEGYITDAIERVRPFRLVLMLDEFDKLQDGIVNGVTSPQVPENLRYLFQNHTEMAGILTGVLRRLREQYFSALFGFGFKIPVGALDQAAAEELVQKPVEGRLRYSDTALRLVVELTARQPYLIQVLGSKLFAVAAGKAARHIGVVDVEAAADAIATDNEHFATLWRHHLENDRQRYVLWLCHRLVNGPDPVTQDLLDLKLDESNIPRTERALAEDLAYLQDLEMVQMVMTQGRPTYRLQVPLQGRWMDRHVDHERLRRDAALAAEGGGQ